MRLRVKRLSSDDEVSVVDHLDELRVRLFVSLGFLVVAFVFTFWRHTDIQNFLIKLLKDDTAFGKPLILGVGEQFKIALTVSFWAALIIVLPIVFYQAYAYVVPAFEDGLQRTLWPLLYMTPPLFVAGTAFAYYVVLPPSLTFLLNFDAEVYTVAVGAQQFYGFCLQVMVVMGCIFQIPPLVYLLARVGLVTSAMMRQNRKYALVGCAVVAAFLPSVDPLSMLLEMAPLIILYEASIWLALLVEKRYPHFDPDDDLEPTSA